MAEEQEVVKAEEAVEAKDRGLFDFLGKKEEEKKPHCAEGEAISSEFEEKVHVSEPPHGVEYKEEEKKKLHRSSSSSSSSVSHIYTYPSWWLMNISLDFIKLTASDCIVLQSEEEYEEDGVIKKKKKDKKGLKDKIKEKISGEPKPEVDTSVPVEKCDDEPEEKKGFLDKIKEKLPGGGQKKAEEVPPPPPPAAPVAEEHHEGEPKKGFLDKIKEKLPGYHPKTEEEKEKKDGECH